MPKAIDPVKKIDDYFNSLPNWSKKMCNKLRDLIHQADPEVVEEWKWGQPAFTHKKKQLCFVWPFTNHVNFTLHQGALLKDTHKLFNAGTDNLRSRSIKFTDISQINEKALIDYIQQSVQFIEEGKFIKVPISKDKTVIIPDYIEKILKKEGLLEKYNQQIYTYRKGYVQWIEEAKQDETKQKRINVMVDEVRGGEVYMGMKR